MNLYSKSESCWAKSLTPSSLYLCFCFWRCWGLNTGLCACEVSTLPAELYSQPSLLFFFWGGGGEGSTNSVYLFLLYIIAKKYLIRPQWRCFRWNSFFSTFLLFKHVLFKTVLAYLLNNQMQHVRALTRHLASGGKKTAKKYY